MQSAQPNPPSESSTLEGLFQAHHQRVFRVAYRVTGNASDAEDVLQTVFLRLARRGDELQLGEKVGGYLHRAAVNAGLDLLRARKRSRAVDLEEVGGEEDRAVATPPAQHRSELGEQLRNALAQLSPKAAEIFTLRYVEGYGNTEIADMLGASRTTVAVVLHRARHRLQKELGSQAGVTS